MDDLLDWSKADHLTVIENSVEEVVRIEQETVSIWGRSLTVITESDIEALRNGKLLIYGDGEYSTVVKLGGSDE